MSRCDIAVLSIFVTVIFTRLFLLLLLALPINSASIYNDQFHHYYLGLLVLLVSLFFKRSHFRTIIIGTGLGLIIDEFMLPLYILGLWKQGYWSLFGILPVVVVLLIVFSLFLLRRRPGR